MIRVRRIVGRWPLKRMYEVQFLDEPGAVSRTVRVRGLAAFLIAEVGTHGSDAWNWQAAADQAFASGSLDWLSDPYYRPEPLVAVRSLDEADVADGIVAALRNWSRWDEYVDFESADVVEVDGAPGIAMKWTYRSIDAGANTFGLRMPISRLRTTLYGAGSQETDVDHWFAYLLLAVEEPHSPSTDGSRFWFDDLPSH